MACFAALHQLPARLVDVGRTEIEQLSDDVGLKEADVLGDELSCLAGVDLPVATTFQLAGLRKAFLDRSYALEFLEKESFRPA